MSIVRGKSFHRRPELTVNEKRKYRNKHPFTGHLCAFEISRLPPIIGTGCLASKRTHGA